MASIRGGLILLVTLLSLVAPEPSIAAEPESPSEASSASTPPASEPSPAEISPLEDRLQQETQTRSSRFSILPHKPNYLLPLAYSTSPNRVVYAGTSIGEEGLDDIEVKFQLSIKAPLWENLFDGRGTLFAAYSQLAFWQAYDSGQSSPFREINFEPELFLAVKTGTRLLGVPSQIVTIGLSHQSNGRSEPLSRSWNRVVANLVFGSGSTYVTLRPWYRIPERSEDDDNPDIERFLGYGELFVVKKLRDHTLTLMLRNNLRDHGNKGAVQLDWSFPLHKKLRGYVQYFNGYGESLVDYNHAGNRLGVGIMLNDWL